MDLPNLGLDTGSQPLPNPDVKMSALPPLLPVRRHSQQDIHTSSSYPADTINFDRTESVARPFHPRSHIQSGVSARGVLPQAYHYESSRYHASPAPYSHTARPTEGRPGQTEYASATLPESSPNYPSIATRSPNHQPSVPFQAQRPAQVPSQPTPYFQPGLSRSPIIPQFIPRADAEGSSYRYPRYPPISNNHQIGSSYMPQTRHRRRTDDPFVANDPFQPRIHHGDAVSRNTTFDDIPAADPAPGQGPWTSRFPPVIPIMPTTPYENPWDTIYPYSMEQQFPPSNRFPFQPGVHPIPNYSPRHVAESIGHGSHSFTASHRQTSTKENTKADSEQQGNDPAAAYDPEHVVIDPDTVEHPSPSVADPPQPCIVMDPSKGATTDRHNSSETVPPIASSFSHESRGYYTRPDPQHTRFEVPFFSGVAGPDVGPDVENGMAHASPIRRGFLSRIGNYPRRRFTHLGRQVYQSEWEAYMSSEEYHADDRYQIAITFLSRTLPIWIYHHLLLRLPSLYYSRVARIFEEADLTLSEIKTMALQTTSQGKVAPFDIQALEYSNVPPQYGKLKSTWDSFIESIMREWKTFNIISVLLLSAILTILQIEGAATDPVIRYTALLSLICALISLLFGCVYIIRFGSMKKTYKAAEWALEAKKSKTTIWWNVWVLLAMPAIWLSWSILLYIVCIMSFIWRTSSQNETVPANVSNTGLLVIRVAITAILGLGIIYGYLILATFSRYGEVMDRAWKMRINGWLAENRFSPRYPSGIYPYPFIPPLTPPGYPTRHPPAAFGPSHTRAEPRTFSFDRTEHPPSTSQFNAPIYSSAPFIPNDELYDLSAHPDTAVKSPSSTTRNDDLTHGNTLLNEINPSQQEDRKNNFPAVFDGPEGSNYHPTGHSRMPSPIGSRVPIIHPGKSQSTGHPPRRLPATRRTYITTVNDSDSYMRRHGTRTQDHNSLSLGLDVEEQVDGASDDRVRLRSPLISASESLNFRNSAEAADNQESPLADEESGSVQSKASNTGSRWPTGHARTVSSPKQHPLDA